MRILIVEDHADSVEALARLLRSRGYQIAAARSGAEALTLCDGGEGFDLLIADIGLPDIDGRELLRQVRRTCAMPAIAISGYARAEDVAQSLAAGFDLHLNKPVEFSDLTAAVARFARPPGSAAAAGD